MVAAVSMVRDEADIVTETVGRMARQVDLVIVADNDSKDGTLDALWGLQRTGTDNLDLIDDPDPAYYQSEKMSRLAERARQAGAEWIVPFDADEIWLTDTADLRVADLLADMPAEAMLVDAQVIDHVATGQDPEGLPPVRRMGWRRPEALPLRKVACRAVEGLVIHMGNHGATFPDHPYPLTASDRLAVRHFPYRSPEQMIRKARNGAAAYAATDLPEEVGKHWRDYGRLSDEQLSDVFRQWFWEADPEAAGFVWGPCPR